MADAHTQAATCHICFRTSITVHWQNGGSTSLDNAVMLCRFHHNIIHQTKVKVRLNENQIPEFLLEPNAQQEAWLRNIVHRGT